MKKLKNSISPISIILATKFRKLAGTGVLVISLPMLSLFLLSGFTPDENIEADNDRNIVIIDNGRTFGWSADNCDAPMVMSTSARLQLMSNGFVMLDIVWQLPEGHCDIPERGAVVTRYDDLERSVITPDGLVHGKIFLPPGN